MNRLAAVQGTLQRFQLLYGTSANLYRPLVTTVDLTSGEQTRSYTISKINAILLPYKLDTIFTVIKVHGGDGRVERNTSGRHDKTERTCITKSTIGNEVKMTDFIVFSGFKYAVSKVENFAEYGVVVLTLSKSESDSEFFHAVETEVSVERGDS